MLFPLIVWAMQMWMKYSGFSNTSVGFVSIATLPILLKMPLMGMLGKLSLKGFLGSRNNERGWLLFASCGYAGSLLSAIIVTPYKLVVFILLLGMGAFFASLLELIIEMIRLQNKKNPQNVMVANLGMGDRVGAILSKTGVLCVVSYLSWPLCVSILVIWQAVSVFSLQSLNEKSPKKSQNFLEKDHTFQRALSDLRNRIGLVGLIFPLLILISEAFVRPMVGVMLVDLAFSEKSIALAFAIHYIGGLVGAWLFLFFLPKTSVLPRLWWAGFINFCGSLLFSLVPIVGNLGFLVMVMLISGLGQGVFLQTLRMGISFVCSKKYHFVQIAWFLCVWSMTAAIACTSGWVADLCGWWPLYFLLASFTYLPTGSVLLFLRKRPHGQEG